MLANFQALDWPCPTCYVEPEDLYQGIEVRIQNARGHRPDVIPCWLLNSSVPQFPCYKIEVITAGFRKRVRVRVGVVFVSFVYEEIKAREVNSFLAT